VTRPPEEPVMELRLAPAAEGYRLAFIGPDRFETVAVFRTFTAALAAWRAAAAAAAWLSEPRG